MHALFKALFLRVGQIVKPGAMALIKDITNFVLKLKLLSQYFGVFRTRPIHLTICWVNMRSTMTKYREDNDDDLIFYETSK